MNHNRYLSYCKTYVKNSGKQIRNKSSTSNNEVGQHHSSILVENANV